MSSFLLPLNWLELCLINGYFSIDGNSCSSSISRWYFRINLCLLVLCNSLSSLLMLHSYSFIFWVKQKQEFDWHFHLCFMNLYFVLKASTALFKHVRPRLKSAVLALRTKYRFIKHKWKMPIEFLLLLDSKNKAITVKHEGDWIMSCKELKDTN